MTGRGRVFGLIGWPGNPALSSKMYRAAFASAKSAASYVEFAVEPDGLSAAIRGARALGIAGLNITTPHTQSVMSLLDELDESAVRADAVNTVAVRGGRLVGGNTAASGFVDAMDDEGVQLTGKAVVVLGVGGAARAVVAAAIARRASDVRVVARSVESARGLVSFASLQARGVELGLRFFGRRESDGRRGRRLSSRCATRGRTCCTALLGCCFTPRERRLLGSRLRLLRIWARTNVSCHGWWSD